MLVDIPIGTPRCKDRTLQLTVDHINPLILCCGFHLNGSDLSVENWCYESPGNVLNLYLTSKQGGVVRWECVGSEPVQRSV
jgi:hypothetical protein